MLNGLDLFSGIGGISIALREWVTPVAYCENDRYAQAVLLSRMQVGDLHCAPVWDDITTLRGELLLQNSIDIICGGFPCQDISCAGLGKGLGGERSKLYFELYRLVKEISPRFVFLENVPAIRTKGLYEVVSSLTDIGYDCRWTCVSAAEVGANHLRKRWFLLASKRIGTSTDTNSNRLGNGKQEQQVGTIQTDIERISIERESKLLAYEPWCGGETVDDTYSERGRGEPRTEQTGRREINNASWWSVEPAVGGTLDGVYARLDRTKCLGEIAFEKELSETGAGEIMSYVQDGAISESLWKTIRGFGCIQAAEILLSFVREYEAGGRLSRELLESEATPEGLLREMQFNRQSARPPLRRESAEQFFGEYPDALRELSQLVASRGQTPWSSSMWEMSVERITNGLPNRVDRIKCLGNAVVPLQAREAFKRLMGII